MRTVNGTLQQLWSRRRWAYAVYLVVATTRIPARTGFHLGNFACDMRLTGENVGLSLTKLPHIILFGAFFLLTVAQFDRLDRRALTWSVAATLALGVLVEVEEGATRTGNCRMTDVLPDLCGALIAAVLITSIALIQHRLKEALATRTNR
jgi:VanZ family protein